MISPGDMAFFFAIIISHSRDFLRVISGFLGEKGFGYFIIPFGVMVSLRVILRWLVGYLAPLYVVALRWAVLLTVILSFFIFFFCFKEISKHA